MRRSRTNSAPEEEENRDDLSFYDREKLKRVENMFPICQEDVVLDFGCGHGWRSLEASDRARLIFALDISLELLRALRNTLKKNEIDNVFLVLGDAQQAPFKDDSCDKILCTSLLQNVTDDRCVLREVYRTLRAGGRALILVPDSRVESAVYRLGPRHFQERGILRIYSLDELIERVTAARFTITGYLRIGFIHSVYYLMKALFRLKTESVGDTGLVVGVPYYFLSHFWGAFETIYYSKFGRLIDRLGETLLPCSLLLFLIKD
jgi:SAM-dependent methyltransferase